MLDNRHNFNIILNLSKAQPWTVNENNALDRLLFEDCNTEDQQSLIIDLLHRFTYISGDKYHKLLRDLARKITEIEGIVDTTTQVVAMAADSTSDSSQFVLYVLKTQFESLGWRGYKHINRFTQSWHIFKKDKLHKNIVLIDEFVGSGSTVVGRIKELKRIYAEKGVYDMNFYVRVVSSTQQGLDFARAEGINIESLIIINKGISDHFPDDVAREKISLMVELENILSASYNEREMPSLGYGATESLYNNQVGNTPNSVFPIFWWPFFKDGSARSVLLTRAMGDA